MPSINLLPWRQELRQRRRKEFLYGIVGAVLEVGNFTLTADWSQRDLDAPMSVEVRSSQLLGRIKKFFSL